MLDLTYMSNSPDCLRSKRWRGTKTSGRHCAGVNSGPHFACTNGDRRIDDIEPRKHILPQTPAAPAVLYNDPRRLIAVVLLPDNLSQINRDRLGRHRWLVVSWNIPTRKCRGQARPNLIASTSYILCLFSHWPGKYQFRLNYPCHRMQLAHLGSLQEQLYIDGSIAIDCLNSVQEIH